MHNRPVLFFDSGIGGLSVLREARILMPDRRFIYVADDAGFPYGGWEEGALKQRIVALFEGFIAVHDPVLCLIACNTASTIVMDELRAAFPHMPFVGTVPAVKPAAERTRSGLVSVLATPGTVKRQYTRDLIGKYAAKCHVRLVGSENLAGLAETYMREGFVDERLGGRAEHDSMPHGRQVGRVNVIGSHEVAPCESSQTFGSHQQHQARLNHLRRLRQQNQKRLEFAVQ